MRYLKIPMEMWELDCKREFVQGLSGNCRLYFAIGSLTVLLPMNPHIDPVVTKPRKRKKEKKGK